MTTSFVWLKDANAATFAQAVEDSTVGTQAVQNPHVVLDVGGGAVATGNPLPVTIISAVAATGVALDGTDATGVTAPTGATGLRGWASALFKVAAQDGVDATGVTAPTGGSGIRGWLSGMFNLMARDGTDATGVTPPGGAVGIRGWLSGMFNLMARDGTDATGVTPPGGAVGIRGWLSGMYSKLPSFGVAGTASANVLTVQGIASGTALSVTLPSGVETAPGTAGTQALTMQGNASGIPLPVKQAGSGSGADFSNVTSPTTGLTSLGTYTVVTAGALFVQNQDAYPLLVMLDSGSGTATPVVLDQAAASGREGSFLPALPWFTGRAVVWGNSASHRFGARGN